jgi:hypothetical protein
MFVALSGIAGIWAKAICEQKMKAKIMVLALLNVSKNFIAGWVRSAGTNPKPNRLLIYYFNLNPREKMQPGLH